jgi:hypothetical protein
MKYLIREIFIAKPGHAGELAELTKKEMANWPDFKGHVLLDMVTDFNKIVVEWETESLVDWAKMMDEMNRKKEEAKAQAKEQAKPPKYTELYLTGKREIYRIV